MKNRFNWSVRMALAAAAVVLAATLFAQPERGPLEIAAENAALAEKYARSIVTVRYYVKRDAEGNSPDLSIPYKCPNCNGTHWNDGGVSSEKGIPAEFAGFLLAPDRVLMRDVKVDPAYVDRIEVVCGDETRGATEVEVLPDRKGLVLKTETAFAQGKPLVFTGGAAPKRPRYFYLVQEGGVLTAGIAASKSERAKYLVPLGRAFYEGNPNTLVLDEKGEPVTVALEELVELGQEVFSAPSTWKREPVAARQARLEALKARVQRGVCAVSLQFEPKTREMRSGIRFSSDGDEVGTEMDAIGLVMEKGTVVVLANLAPSDTARLTKMEAKLADGTSVPLMFTGSYLEEGAFAAAFEGGLPAGVQPFACDRRGALELYAKTFNSCLVENRGGDLKLTLGTVAAAGTTRVKGNELVADLAVRSGPRERVLSSERGSKVPIALSESGELLAMGVKGRPERDWDELKFTQGRRLLALVEKPVFNGENVPRASEDRRRTPWLGVEVQVAGVDALREKKALGFLKGYRREMAAMVSDVAPGSPADQLGIKVGDVLLTARPLGVSEGRSVDLSASRDYLSSINWEEAFGDERFIEVASSGEVTPWPNLETGVNGELAMFGVGAKMEIAWVSDGVRKSGTTTLALAPVHYQNAPRARNKELAMTVCDMTAEVRKFFKFDEQAPGVVIAKIKSGGPAAVAGLRPLELVTEVDGEGVASAKDFQEKIKGKKEFSLTVRRLTTTRIVPLKMP